MKPVALTLALFAALGPAFAEERNFRILGLFAPERVADLKDTLGNIPDVTLVSVDFARSEATLRYDPKTAFPGAKPEQVTERLDGKLRSLSHATFGARPPCATPADKLVRHTIAVGTLDCKACALAAYEAVAKLDGVERATVSTRDGVVEVWCDPKNAAREPLESALRKKGFPLPSPATSR